MCHRPAINCRKNSYLGLHLDSAHFEAILLDADLQVTHTAVVRYDVDLPEYATIRGISSDAPPNEFKVNPVMYVKALDILLNCLASQGADMHRIAAIGGAAHQYGTIFWTEMGFRRLCGLNPSMRLHEQVTDKAFEIVSSPSWAIRSSIVQCNEMQEELGGVLTLCKITGSKCFGRFTGPQIRKVYQESPAQYARIIRISLISSFLSSLLVGSIGSIDHCSGSIMSLLNINRKTWSKKCLAACAPDLEQRLMSPIAPNRLQGRIAKYFVNRWNFRPDCMVVSCIVSGASMVAGLNIEENTLVLLLSSTDKLLMGFKKRPHLDEGLVMCHPTNIGEYLGCILFRNGSQVRESVCNELANGDWKLFNEMIASTPMGNDGNIEVRLDNIEYTPEAKGTLRWDSRIDEMSIEALKGRDQFEDIKYEARAVIEGQIMLRRVLAIDAGFNIHKSTKIVVLVNSLKCDKILQIIADVFNAPVYTQQGPLATIMGAAYRARYAFYEYRQANCNCQRCKIRRGRAHKLSYAEFFKHLPDKLQLSAEPQPGCASIYNPLTERCRKMCRLLAARTYLNIDKTKETV